MSPLGKFLLRFGCCEYLLFTRLDMGLRASNRLILILTFKQTLMMFLAVPCLSWYVTLNGFACLAWTLQVAKRLTYCIQDRKYGFDQNSPGRPMVGMLPEYRLFMLVIGEPSIALCTAAMLPHYSSALVANLPFLPMLGMALIPGDVRPLLEFVFDGVAYLSGLPFMIPNRLLEPWFTAHAREVATAIPFLSAGGLLLHNWYEWKGELQDAEPPAQQDMPTAHGPVLRFPSVGR